MTVMNGDDPARPEPLSDDECPKCDKCGAPVTTGMMAMLCPHARACAFVDDDEHWEGIEEFRKELGIERVTAGSAASGVPPSQGGQQ